MRTFPKSAEESDEALRPPTKSDRGPRRKLISCLASVVIVAFLATAANAANPSNLSAQVQLALDRVVAAGFPGAIALVRAGNQTVRLSSGNSNLAPVSPMRAHLRSRMGGVTKSFAATVFLNDMCQR